MADPEAETLFHMCLYWAFGISRFTQSLGIIHCEYIYIYIYIHFVVINIHLTLPVQLRITGFNFSQM